MAIGPEIILLFKFESFLHAISANILINTMSLCYRYERLHNEVRICLVGKYTSLEDAYTSVIKALRHAAVYCNYKVDIQVCYHRVSFLVLPNIMSDQGIRIFHCHATIHGQLSWGSSGF